jgi:hypothetical protein
MYDKSTNEITFPHTIPTNKLGGKTHTWNDVNGGAKMLSDLCIDPNSFWGGNVLVLGWIKQYGMYACQHKDTYQVVGFYVHDPSLLTERGKKLVKEAFPNKTVKFELYSQKQPTLEEKKKLEDMKQYYKEHGMSPVFVDTANAEELIALEKALASGKAEKPVAVVQSETVKPMLTEPVEHEHDGSMVSPKILEGRAKPGNRYIK